jgi:Domain of unknown function (DUF4390)
MPEVLPVRLAPFAVRGACLLLLALALPAPAYALDVDVSPARTRDGYVWLELRLSDLFDARVEQSLARGMPATLEIGGELWRRRNGWFDRLEHGVRAALRVRYDVWSEEYLIERADAPIERYRSLDSLRAALARPIALPIARVEALRRDHRYYTAVTVTLRPLSVEDVQEVEGWLSGEVVTKRRAGFGIVTALPSAVFDAVRNFSGFGDKRARAIGGEFALEALEEPAPS